MTSALEKRVILEESGSCNTTRSCLVNLTKAVLILCIRCALKVQCTPMRVVTLVKFLLCSLSAIAVLKKDVAAKKQKNIESLKRTRSPGNFGRNGKVCFGFFRSEYSGSPLEVVYLFRLEYSDRNSPFHI